MTPDLHSALPELVDLARRAGNAILSVYAETGLAWDVKADQSPLTEADRAADAVVCEALERSFPGHVVLSEERAAADLSGTDWVDGFFLVDPLDGTREFLARNGEFTVNIAFVCAGRPVLGVVHAPAVGSTYWGASGHGAWRQAADDEAPRPMRTAPLTAGPGPLRLLASRSHGSGAQDAFISNWPKPRPEVVLAGSSLKFCRVAEGAADLYPRVTPTMAWDTAAGQAVLQAAGGAVWNMQGQPLLVPRNPHAQANGPFVAAASEALAATALPLLRAVTHAR